MVGGASVATAQVNGVGIGPKIGLYLDGSLFMLGGVAQFPFTQTFDLEPGVELVFGGGSANVSATRVVLDANGRYSFNILGSDIRPFLSGGVGLVLDFISTQGASDTKTDFRLNVGGGTTFNSRSLIQPWAGLKIVLLADQSDVLLQGGVNFYL